MKINLIFPEALLLIFLDKNVVNNSQYGSYQSTKGIFEELQWRHVCLSNPCSIQFIIKGVCEMLSLNLAPEIFFWAQE